MTEKNPDLRLYSGIYLAFPNSFLGKSRPFMSEQERAAADIIRGVIEKASFVGVDPIAKVHEIERRALAAIEREGLEAFVKRHSAEQPDTEEPEAVRNMAAG